MSEASELGTRLREWRESLGLTREVLAARTGIPGGTIRNHEAGISGPKADQIARYAEVGLDPTWLVTGKRRDQLLEGGQAEFGLREEPASYEPGLSIDAELLGRVVDRVARIYREAGMGLPDVDLGRLAAQKYAEIQAIAGDPEEWAPALDLMAVRLRRALLQAAAEPGASKSRA